MPLPAQTGISGIRIGKMGINTLFHTIPGRICYCHIVPELNIECVRKIWLYACQQVSNGHGLAQPKFHESLVLESYAVSSNWLIP